MTPTAPRTFAECYGSRLERHQIVVVVTAVGKHLLMVKDADSFYDGLCGFFDRGNFIEDTEGRLVYLGAICYLPPKSKAVIVP